MEQGFVSWQAVATQQHVRNSARDLREARRVSPEAFAPDITAMLEMLEDLDERIEASLEKASKANAVKPSEDEE